MVLFERPGVVTESTERAGAAGVTCELTVDFVATTVGRKSDMVGIKAGGDSRQVVNVDITANATQASDLARSPMAAPI